MSAALAKAAESQADLNTSLDRHLQEAHQPADQQKWWRGLDATVHAYKRHKAAIERELQDEEKRAAAPAEVPPPILAQPEPPKAPSQAVDRVTLPRPDFMFGQTVAAHKPPAATAPPAPPAAATSATSNTFAFSFGSSSATPSSGFALGAFTSSTFTPGAPSSFTFSAAPLAASGGAEAEEEEEEQRPPSPSLVKGSADDEKEDTAAEANAKVYVMDGGWKDICKGTLLVRVDKEPGANGVKGARLVMRNDTGKVKLNARLYPGLKIKLEEKALTMSLVNCIVEEKLPPQPGAPHPAAEPPAAAPPTLKLTMLRVASSDVAKRIHAAITSVLPV